MAESRIQKSLLNAKVNLIFYALTLALSFFSRKIFLNCLGADFVGLTGTLQNLLGFLNLAELGIGAAIGYVLYKPLFDKDQPKITEIISVFGYLYSRIGYLILAGGILLSCFLPLIFPKTGFQWGVIYFAFYAFLFSSLIGYFCNYKQTLLGADQKNYVVTAYFQSANILKTLIQLVSAWYTRSFYLWIIIELLFGILYSLILNWKMKQTYPWLASEVSQGRALFKKYPEVMKYTKQLFVHKMATFVQFQTTPFLIYSFVSLQTVAYFGNYSIITEKLSGLVNNFLGSTGASVGNLIAEGNTEKIISIFWELFALRMLIAGIICTSLFFLMEPFISLWLGSKYVLGNSILILVIINIYIGFTRGVTDQFLNGYGLFYDMWAPITESVISLVIAIIGGYLWGLPGVLLGGIISLFLIVGVWKPFFLFHSGFKRNVLSYWMGYLKHLLLISFPAFICYGILPRITHITPSNSWGNWIIYATYTVSIYTITTALILYPFSKGIRNLVTRIFRRFHKNEI